jgi:Protein of unknown function, DUF481
MSHPYIETRVLRVGIAALAACLCLIPVNTHARDRTDVVVLTNGDHITGEIVGMSRGKVDFRGVDTGRFSFEWLNVATVTSEYVYIVEVSSGETYLGPLLASGLPGTIRVGPDAIPIDRVVAITSVDDAFWSRVRAFLDLGFTLAKSNNATTFSAGGEFAFRGEQLGFALSGDSFVQSDSSGLSVSRNSLLLNGTYYFAPWRAILFTGLDQNEELDLLLRVSLGAGVAHSLVRNSWTELWLTAGLSQAHERYSSGDSIYSLSAFVEGTWEAFRFDSPELDLLLDQKILPVLTELGRVRGTTTLRAKYEVFNNFNVGVNFSFTFDTRPPDPAAPNTDYIAALTLGWSYRR